METRQRTRVEPERSGRPADLWNRVVETRAAVACLRNQPASQSKCIARDEFLAALEAYVTDLTDHGRPIPYGLHNELQIRRLTRYQ